MPGYLEKLFNLDGKVAALTGAGGFLVGEMARSLGRAGVKVACVDTRLADARKTADSITDSGGDALATSSCEWAGPSALVAVG